MLRKLSNILTKKDVKNIGKAFNNIKTNEKYLSRLSDREIITEGILKEPKIRKIHNQIIYPKAISFNYDKHQLFPAFKNAYHLQLEKTFLEWSISEDNLIDLGYYYDKKTIQVVICNRETKFNFWYYRKYEDILKVNEILIYDNDTPIRFFNHDNSDLAFFLYTNELKEEVVENYAY